MRLFHRGTGTQPELGEAIERIKSRGKSIERRTTEVKQRTDFSDVF